MKSSCRALRHNGFIRTRDGERYVERSLESALADPALRPHCKWAGNLFPELAGRTPTIEAVESIFRNRHPVTGDPLKRTVNSGTRREGDKEVSNVCSGFTVALGAPKEVSIAALVFEDMTVFEVADTCLAKALDPLTDKIDRRQPRPRREETLPTGLGMFLTVLEAVNREGAPHLHRDTTFMNVTAYEENGRRRYCAAHLRRLAKSVAPAWRRAYRMMYRELKRNGYLVHGTAAKWQLAGVPKYLTAQWSTKMSPSPAPVSASLPKVEAMRQAKRRDQKHKCVRPKKVFRLLASWQSAWRAELGPDQAESLRQIYEATHTANRNRHNLPASSQQAVPTAEVTATESDTVLQPIRKATLLAEVEGLRKTKPSLASCADVISYSHQVLQESLVAQKTGLGRRHRVKIIADTNKFPWVMTVGAILGLSFPATTFNVEHFAGASPRLREGKGRRDPAVSRSVTSVATHVLSQFEKLPGNELDKLKALLDDGADSLRPHRRGLAPESHHRPTANGAPAKPSIDLMP